VLEAVFVLLEFPSPSRRIFIGSHSLPPLWFAVSVLHSHELGDDGGLQVGHEARRKLATHFISLGLVVGTM
jgi:hypothetical protein